MRVLIKMIYTVGVEDGGAANDAMHLITPGNQQFRQIRPILTGYAGDQSPFGLSRNRLMTIFSHNIYSFKSNLHDSTGINVNQL